MNNKLVLMAAGVLALSSSAFAQTYNCEILKDASGSAILGGPSYAVQFSGENAVLAVTTGADEGGLLSTVDIAMDKTEQEVDGSIYEAAGVTVTTFPGLGGKSSITLSQTLAGKSYSATCTQGTVNPALVKQWQDGTDSLTISGNSASITFVCGNIFIAKGWNTDGEPMDGMDKGGPVEMGPGTPVTVTARLRDGKLYLRTGTGAASQYVFTPGGAQHGELCL